MRHNLNTRTEMSLVVF